MLLQDEYMDTEINIVNLRHVKNIDEWIRNGVGRHVYVGREVHSLTRQYSDFKWGNPYRLRDHNHSREKVLELFQLYLQHNQELLESVSELKGKILGCWCAPGKCHAEVLHRLAGNHPVYEHSTTVTMASTKKRTKKKSPQRRSTRNKQKSLKGKEHDQYMLNDSDAIADMTPLTASEKVSEIPCSRRYNNIACI